MGARISKLMLLLMLSGCPSGPDQTASFVGTWAVTSGKSISTCPGSQPVERDLSTAGEMLTITGAGSQQLLVNVSPGAACPTRFSVAGDLASADSGQSCSGAGVTSNILDSTLTLSGGMLSVSYDTSWPVNGMTCTLVLTGVATRR